MEKRDHDTVICANCGKQVKEERSQYAEHQYFCQDCADELFSICENCGDVHYSDDMHWQDDACYCESCFDAKYTTCENCGDVVAKDDTSYMGGANQTVCESCHSDHYFTCSHCEETYHDDDYGSDGLCQDCWERRQERERERRLTNKVKIAPYTSDYGSAYNTLLARLGKRDLVTDCANYYVLSALTMAGDKYINEAFKSHSKVLADQFAVYLRAAIASELHHAHSLRNGMMQEDKMALALDSDRKFITDAIGVFANLREWPGSNYGGQAWVKIANLLLEYVDGKMRPELFCDRVWTIQHNCGTVLDKWNGWNLVTSPPYIYKCHIPSTGLSSLLDIQANKPTSCLVAFTDNDTRNLASWVLAEYGTLPGWANQ